MSHHLESARLSFVPCSETDLDLLRIHWTQAEVRRFLFDDQIVEPEAVSGLINNSQSSFSRCGYGLWKLLHKNNGQFCGVCGFTENEGTPELIFSIEPDYWGRGLAQESADCTIDYLFNALGVDRIIASVDRPNTASIQVLDKIGMSLQSNVNEEAGPLLFYERLNTL